MTHRAIFAFIATLIAVFRLPAQADQLIYGDVLANGWVDWSWAATSLTNASPVHTGTRSIGVTATAYQGAYFHHAAFDSSQNAAITFWIHGGSAGGQLLQVAATRSGNPQPAVELTQLPSNQWQAITLTLAQLGVSQVPDMDGFWIQDRSGTTKPRFFLDDIALTELPPPAIVHLTIDATQIVRTVDARMFGINVATWDSVLTTPTTLALLTELDNQVLRFPGGSLSDEYHWASNTTGTNTWTWSTSFAKFAQVATGTHAQVILTANYGTGTPAEAAAWVRHANITNAYGFQYWEIGNENYGDWETDTNTRPHDPFTYATRFKDYYIQMKAADASIKIGAVIADGEDAFATYTDHPATNPRTSQVHNGWTPVMLSRLKSLGVTPDFAIYHRYPQNPGQESDAGLLQSSGAWTIDAARLRLQLNDYLGQAATNVEMLCTENNSVSSTPGKQMTSLVNGLYLADSLAHAMQTEFNALIWWDLRNGELFNNNNAPELYGWRLYGDYGLVNYDEPAGPADRYPSFYVAKLLQHFARGGDRVLHAASDSTLLAAFAARHADGDLALLVINKSPQYTLHADISITGFIPHSNAVMRAYGISQDEAAHTGVGSADVAQTNLLGAATNFLHDFAPYSAAVITFSPMIPPPKIAHVTGDAISGVTFSWTVTEGGQYQVECCNQLGTLWATSDIPRIAGPGDTTLSYTDSTDFTSRFCRVRVLEN